MNTVSKKLIKPTAAGIQEMARGYFSVDVRNGSVSMTEADGFIDKILGTYTDVLCRYITYETGHRCLLVTSLTGRAKYFQIKITD